MRSISLPTKLKPWTMRSIGIDGDSDHELFYTSVVLQRNYLSDKPRMNRVFILSYSAIRELVRSFNALFSQVK